jgi:hypothetical protein
MVVPRFHNRIGKVCALVAATLILPVVAYAQQNNNGQNNNGQNNNRPSVPDGGPGIVLLTTAIGAVLLFSWRQSSRAKAGSQPQRP